MYSYKHDRYVNTKNYIINNIRHISKKKLHVMLIDYNLLQFISLSEVRKLVVRGK